MGGRWQQAGDRDRGLGGAGVWGIGRGGEDGAAGERGVDCGRGGVEMGAWTGDVVCGGAEGEAGVCKWGEGAGSGHG